MRYDGLAMLDPGLAMLDPGLAMLDPGLETGPRLVLDWTQTGLEIDF